MLVCSSITAQQDSLVVVEADEKYFEDQFYFGINYNILVSTPHDISQNSFSYGIIGGFIKDFPINRRRNIGFGLGAGLSFNAIYSDLMATKNANGTIAYQEVPDTIDYNRNKLSMNFVEFPIEFRWRSSKAEDYRFWRVYAGFKLSYLFTGRSKFVTSDERIVFSNKDIRDLQYGIYLSFGYNTWNFYAQYDLTSIFEDNVYTVGGEPIAPRTLKAGLIFYIL
ncbi:porin family protein [Galbibacter sp. PAP.153]|uniref:porin family protein n=1 Tax=Galbibacter sp. PAP.153 TaxID=3104623 RepID=UPI00300AEB47